MDAIQQAFVVESRELLQMMEDNLLQLENSGGDPEIINAIFRAAHTIKGGAGVIECRFIVEFTHVLENLLDEMRAGTIVPDRALIEVLLACSDQLGKLMGCVESDAEPDEELNQASRSLREQLQRYLGAPASASKDVALSEAEVQAVGGGEMETDNWHISLRFGPDVLRKGMDPASFLRYLMEFGQIVQLVTLPDAMPAADEMDAESCYLGFEISYKSDADKARIESVFDFVRDDCVIHIWPPHSKLADFIASIESLPEDTMRLGEILIKCGALTQNELDLALDAQSDREVDAPQPKIGEVLVDQGVITPEVVEAAAVKQNKVAEKKNLESQLIRVQAAKLDQLIDLVGEMVIASAGANMLAHKSGETALAEATSVITMLVEQIRDSALQLRMVQIGETFSRFHRVVRDTSRELDKDIELVISGNEAELDKSVVEKLGDPLMHLVRNALDHGIESPQVRIAKGKPPRGTLRLNAYHESGSIAIEITDDGAGLNREKILSKARERELIGPNQTLSDSEAFALIFEPGFSTAEKVTNISGRGVGLDVVKRNITALRGSVEVESKEGQGSTFRIRLPLTLAIIDGFLVGVGKASYVIPLGTVVECIELSEKARTETNNRQYINLRGEVLPFVRLREQFEISEQGGKRENIVVVQYAGQKIGLVVDELMGEFQTVIKPLGTIFKHIKGIGGSTILGSGEVALILDVQSLVALATVQQNRLQSAEAVKV
ncbi:MAG: chemotaxis protein CheA [Nitrosomonadales bacterium]|nr:chemotaxis protein CheA [Nitrosomonadales bacterium]